ncbi:hypothetical protein TWF481_000308 [Arthrobotrys musiformis]|uniref:F-box domain-containing protein n=1 Tax=Arthrobotrys musiformis TaxID=47236 RepID=A0AAV9WP81_9PEZI
MECKSILDLPLDIKLDFLSSLDSVTCLRKVLHREIGIAGRALVRMRRFKANKTEAELIEALPSTEDEKPESPQAYLSELLSVRRPVRFFSRLFFQTRFRNRRVRFQSSIRLEDILEDMETVTDSEYARVDEAYYTIWLYRELNYNVELRSFQHVTAINEWAFWKKDGSLQVVPDLGILSHVLRVTSLEIIYPHVLQYHQTLSQEELETIATVVDALCLYEKHGVASMLITQLGFDGLQEVLEISGERMRETISNIYWNPVRADLAGGSISNSITQFPTLITNFWHFIEPTYQTDIRRVWRYPGGVYRRYVAPWNQYPPFDITALVWDDKRLESWGYVYPMGTKDSHCEYDMALEEQMCAGDCSVIGCAAP